MVKFTESHYHSILHHSFKKDKQSCLVSELKQIFVEPKLNLVILSYSFKKKKSVLMVI